MTALGRLSIRIKLVLLAGVPVIGALVLAAIIAQDARQRAASAAALGSIEDLAHLSSQMGATVHALQAERATIALHEGLRGTPVDGASDDDLAAQYRITDEVVAQLEGFLAGRDLSKLPSRLSHDLGAARTDIGGRTAFRARVESETVPVDAVMSFYGGINEELISATAALSQLSDDGELLRSISSLVALSELTERASSEHALLANVFAAGQFPPGAFKTFVTLLTEQAIYTDVFRANASDEETAHFRDGQAADAVKTAITLREKALTNTDDNIEVDPAAWFKADAERLHQLHAIEAVIVRRISAAASGKVAATRASIRLGVGLSIAVVIASSLLAFFIARGVTRTISDLASAAARVRQTKDFAIRAKKTSTDELGTLTDAFNEMLSDIQTRDTELADHRHNLEGMVAARTKQLEARNESTRLVLDNVEQGLATIGRDGTLATERSAAFDRILGVPAEGAKFAEHVGQSDARVREMLDLGWEMVVEDFMPRDIALAQMPKRVVHNGAHIDIGFTPIVHEDSFDGALLVVTDVTSQVNAQLEQERQREYVAVFERVAQDREGFIEFAGETGKLLDRLGEGVNDAPTAMALVHTVKGNSAQWGVSSVARIAHELETQIVDSGTLPSEEQTAELINAWTTMATRFKAVVGKADASVELSHAELDEIIADLRTSPVHETLAHHLATLKHEPTSVRFDRMIHDLERLATRLEKPAPKVVVESNGVRLPASRFGSFWASTVHVVRNLIDHGIESAADRALAGKDEVGTVTLRSTMTDENVILEFSDDGRGINWSAIEAKAREAGIPAATPRDLELALFASGVSTAGTVSDISGRGVGLAAVLERCTELGGKVHVRTTPGKGSAFVFTFPRHTTIPSIRPLRPALRRVS